MITQSFIIDDLNRIASMQEVYKNASINKGEASLVNAETLCTILLIAAVISVTFGASYTTLRNMSKRWNLQNQNIILISYQCTNLCVNLCLGIYGFYHYAFTLPNMSELAVTNRIIGFNDYNIFAYAQIGYNIWALPVGYLLVNESKAMLCHHIATIIVSSFSMLCSYGFRYHQPFFFGLIEISSVPLAIMNYCKSNKEWSKQYCPGVAEMIRPIFAATFLTVRVFMWTPNIYDVIRSSLMILWTSNSVSNQVPLIIFILATTFLTCLQYYWGMLVLKGIIKALSGLKLRVKDVKQD